jgi:hypothetical protein
MGDLRGVLSDAAEQNRLTPALLSLAPSVSHGFWKETLMKYCAQLDIDMKNVPEGKLI